MSIIQVVGSGGEWPSSPASDPNAANLRLAMPFNVGYGVRDVSPKIRGSGSDVLFTQRTTGIVPTYTTDNKFYGTSCTVGEPIGGATRFFANSFTTFSGDFTVETYIKFSSYADTQFALLVHHDNTNSGPQILLTGDTFGDPAARRAVYVNSGAAGSQTTYSSAFSLPINDWYHVAVTRQGSTLRIFINGISSAVFGGTLSYAFTYTGTLTLCSGSSVNTPNTWNTVQIQDLRVYQGVAKYTTNFTPPGAMFL